MNKRSPMSKPMVYLKCFIPHFYQEHHDRFTFILKTIYRTENDEVKVDWTKIITLFPGNTYFVFQHNYGNCAFNTQNNKMLG